MYQGGIFTAVPNGRKKNVTTKAGPQSVTKAERSLHSRKQGVFAQKLSCLEGVQYELHDNCKRNRNIIDKENENKPQWDGRKVSNSAMDWSYETSWWPEPRPS